MKTIVYLITFMTLMSCSEQESTTTSEQKETKSENTPDTLVKDEVGSPVKNSINITGYVKVPPKSMLDVYSKANGFIQDIAVTPGQFVKKGQLLFSITSPEFSKLQMDYLSSKAQLELHQKEMTRIQDLFDSKSVSKKELEQATFNFKNSQAQFEGNKSYLESLGFSLMNIDKGQLQKQVNIYAQIGGYLTSLTANLGQSVGANQLLATVVDTEQVYLELLVPSNQMNVLKMGDVLTFSTQQNVGITENNTAKISAITNQIDMTTGTVKVIALIDPSVKHTLKVGQVVFVKMK
jgi:membrane fusion protein, heavy metal efflux system